MNFILWGNIKANIFNIFSREIELQFFIPRKCFVGLDITVTRFGLESEGDILYSYTPKKRPRKKRTVGEGFVKIRLSWTRVPLFSSSTWWRHPLPLAVHVHCHMTKTPPVGGTSAAPLLCFPSPLWQPVHRPDRMRFARLLALLGALVHAGRSLACTHAFLYLLIHNSFEIFFIFHESAEISENQMFFVDMLVSVKQQQKSLFVVS